MRFLNTVRGGIGIRVLFVFVTLAVVGVCVYSLLEVQRSNIRQNHRIAAERSDQGLQVVMESNADVVRVDPMRFAGVPRTAAPDGWYEVTVSASRADSVVNIRIAATGVCGSEKVVQERSVTLTRRGSDSTATWEP